MSSRARFTLGPFQPVPLTTRPPGPKRVLDVVVGFAGLVAAAPVIAVAAVAMRLSGDDGPLFYRARRIGEAGRPISVVKLRTMREGAAGAGVTSRRDPRVTPVGRLLRRFKLDELPQLWNVLRGEMSLVGPRPEDERYVDWEDPLHRRVFTARPGITGLAQLQFRSEEELLDGPDVERTYRERILPAKLRLDAEYLDRQSVRLDLSLLARTAIAALRPDPAGTTIPEMRR